MGNTLHPIQAVILRELLFHNGSTFSSLNRTDLGNDHFTFHLKKLLKEEIIEKKEKLYFLTQKGKQYAGNLDIFDLKIEQFGVPTVAVTAKKVIDGKVHFLIQQRLKEPLFGYFGMVTGKVKFGELSQDTAKRELMEESGLSGEPRFIAIHHRLRGPSLDEIKLDNFFIIYVVDNPEGKLVDTEEGKNYWKTIEEIKTLNTFPGFEQSIKALTSENTEKYAEVFIPVEEI